MASLFSRVSGLARSSQGRRLTDQARRFVSKPQNRSKLEGLLSRVTGQSASKGKRAGGGRRTGSADRRGSAGRAKRRR